MSVSHSLPRYLHKVSSYLIISSNHVPSSKKRDRTHQFKQISNPPPSANPFTAAITGFFPLRLLIPANPDGGCRLTAAGVSGLERNFACSMRSWPAQKAFFPAPVMIRTRREGSLSYQVRRASASQWEEEGREFMAVGRLMVRRRMPGEG
jgi:hypothetical protein